MQTNWNENHVMLHGRLVQPPKLSHMNHGEEFLVFPLAVARLSGAVDQLNVVVGAGKLASCPLDAGDEVTVFGEVRSFNNRSGIGSRLVISVFARDLRKEEGEDSNMLRLAGTICKEPTYRKTPLGRDICDMMLAVNRRYGRTDYLPCIAWGTLARRCSFLEVGDMLILDGRLQSRVYTKHLEERSEERTAYEVSVMSMDQLLQGEELDALDDGP